MRDSHPSHVLLVPGNFLGPWVWRHVVAGLDRAGVTATPVRLPSSMTSEGAPAGDLHDDAAHVRDILARTDGRVVLCGHSYGGAVITEAATGADPSVAHLVYLAGAMPDAGESLADLAPETPAEESDTTGESVRSRSDGMIELVPESARDALFHDCPTQSREEAVARLLPSNPAVGGQPVRGAAWRDIPTTFVRATADRMPELVSTTVDRQSIDEVEVDAGHCPNWSRPDAVTTILLERIAGSR